MQLIKRAFIALGIIAIASCSHHDRRSNGAGGLRGNSDLPGQPQDGSLIVTPEGTREIKVEEPVEDPLP
ncbi:MAG: hypothetical protein GY899_19225 [Verrucomicrobiaceae bacterium]|nr:hypothetical protein [Verrucomicrobiaceae bacterium]